jgi:hypothetical protein
MSRKRGAERQITKDDADDEETTMASGGFQRASQEDLKKRTILTARRKNKNAGASTSLPTFNFGVTPATTTKKAEVPTAAPAAAPAEAPASFNAFAALKKADTWACASCLLDNESSATQCISCESAKPSAATITTPAAPAAPAGNTFNAFAALKKKNTWQCASCLLDNEETATQCVSCEAVKPGSKAAAPATTTTSAFGTTGGAAPVFGLSAGNAPVFGLSDGNKPASSTPTPAFGLTDGKAPVFGISAPDTDKPAPATPTTPTGFGGTSSFGSGFSFGSVAASSTGFAFGSTSTTFSFPTNSKLDSEQTKSATSDQFSEAKAQSSGTENDKTVCKLRSKVFKWGVPKSTTDGDEKKDEKKADAPAEKKWLECGVGDLHVNQVTCDGKTSARFVMRSDKTHRGILNAPIFKEMKFNVENDKFLRFMSCDLEGNMTQFLLKFKDAAKALQCRKAVEDTIALL